MTRGVTVSSCAALLTVVVLASGCGGGSSTSQDIASPVAMSLEGAEGCLASVGASRAHKSADIGFMKDVAGGDADKAAMAGNGIVNVAEYRPPLIEDSSGTVPPTEYVVWVGRPQGESDDPEATLEEDGSGAFVMFIRHPDRRQLRSGAKCLNELGA